MLLYYITDRKQFPGGEGAQKSALLARIADAARSGVDLIQLREKDLASRQLEELARAAVEAVRGSPSRLLINSRTDVAMACGADGVHLRSHDVTPVVVRSVWHSGKPIIGVSCHSVADVRNATSADFAVFAPVFEKSGNPGVGIERLREACGTGIKVIALGGVTLQNAGACISAGAAGVAGIRLFQDGDLHSTIEPLRRVAEV